MLTAVSLVTRRAIGVIEQSLVNAGIQKALGEVLRYQYYCCSELRCSRFACKRASRSSNEIRASEIISRRAKHRPA
jgi:hypothetical protein